MKKLFAVFFVALFGLLLAVGCSSNSTDTGSGDSAAAGDGELEVITVGASPTPHAEILNAAKDKLAEEGYDLQVEEFTDYVVPNQALDSGSLDANFFQHYPYLEEYNKENGTTLVSAGTVHYEPLGLYAGKTDSIDALADGATIAVPNDTTNEARALILLEDNGLIKLDPNAGFNATKNDIIENPHNINIQELEAAQLARSLQDVDMAVINGNYAIDAGLNVEDALAAETADSESAKTYANVVAVREEDADSAKTQALMKALQSDDVREFIEENYNGSVVPLFNE